VFFLRVAETKKENKTGKGKRKEKEEERTTVGLAPNVLHAMVDDMPSQWRQKNNKKHTNPF
jgi:hypothetical protein